MLLHVSIYNVHSFRLPNQFTFGSCHTRTQIIESIVVRIELLLEHDSCVRDLTSYVLIFVNGALVVFIDEFFEVLLFRLEI